MEKSIANQTEQQWQPVLSQRIQQLYCRLVEHEPSEVTCKLFDNTLTIVLENTLSRPLQLLARNDDPTLAQQVKLNVEAVIKPQLKQIVEEVFGVAVVDLLMDTSLETGRTGTIAILASKP